MSEKEQKDSGKIREDRFTWKAGEVEWIPPEKNKDFLKDLPDQGKNK